MTLESLWANVVLNVMRGHARIICTFNALNYYASKVIQNEIILISHTHIFIRFDQCKYYP